MVRRSGIVVLIGIMVAVALFWVWRRSTPMLVQPAVQILNRDEFDDLIRQHRGRVVLVDFWATWCDPCRRLFPHTQALAERYADRGLSVITMSVDTESDGPAVRDFLASQRAASENYMVRDGGSAEVIEKFEIGSGSIPYVKLYDRRGRLRESIDVPDPDTIDRAVQRLLDEK